MKGIKNDQNKISAVQRAINNNDNNDINNNNNR